jgi:hypothetical protein
VISDIPSSEDFYAAGDELFDFAWDTVARFWTLLSEATQWWGVDRKEVSDDYWAAAQSRLASSLAVTQQGTELILKGKVAAISPYLLLADPPSKWPDPSKPVRFSDMRTVDAQDLVKLFNSVSPQPLSESFVQRFHTLRSSRNRIFHSVDKNLKVATTEVLETILSLYKDLMPHRNWAQVRAKFVQNSPSTKLGAEDESLLLVVEEIRVVIEMLNPASALDFFGINKKKRLYLCPTCLEDFNGDYGTERFPKIAQLRPQTPHATKIYCPVCDATYDILRHACGECEGNVLSPDEHRCLTCAAWVSG